MPAVDVLPRALYLRRDEVTDGKCRDQLLSIAKKTVEEYYVAPPGESHVDDLCSLCVRHTHTLRFNSNFPGEPGLAGCPLTLPYLTLRERRVTA